MDAYLENRFDDCVQHLEEALDAYHRYTRNLIGCRLHCKQMAAEAEPLAGRDIEDLRFYEKGLRNTLCLVRCRSASGRTASRPNKERAAGTATEDQYNVGPDVVNLFEEKKPYEYLQACYNQTGQLAKVASAAFTYLAEHPDDLVMQANLKYYSEQPAVDMNNVINHEAKDYVYLYVHGASAYERKDWDSVVHNMEESLLSYLQSEEECRALCEGPFNQGWFPDFIPAVSNHFTYCLRCKQNCSSKLNSLNGERHDDLLPSHYHFLQYAYFKLGNIKAACSSVASYLLFYPMDESMLHNMKYYSSLPKVETGYFSPRQEAVDYIQRREYESRILKFVFSEFKYDQVYEADISAVATE